MKITDVLTRDEIQRLKAPSDLRGLLAVTTTWALITGALVVAARFTSPLTVLVALVILGGRHLALAILMHDASHYSLFRTRWANDLIGAWLCAYPTWQHLERYREHHLRHHQYAGTPRDPDLSLVTAYPTTRRSLARKFARDLSGVSGLKRLYGLLLMDFGFIRYTVSNEVVRLPQHGRGWLAVARTGLRNLHGVVLTNSALAAAFYFSGHAWLVLLWVGSYLTFFSVFVRIRSIAEHACTEENLDPLKNTRTTYANPLARLTVAPHRVNYHLEHHLLMTVPYFNLPRLHALLKKKKALRHAFVARGYLEVLRTASTATAREPA